MGWCGDGFAQQPPSHAAPFPSTGGHQLRSQQPHSREAWQAQHIPHDFDTSPSHQGLFLLMGMFSVQDLSRSGTGAGMDFCCQTALSGDADKVETHCTSFPLPCADLGLLQCRNSRCQALQSGHTGFFYWNA